MMTYDQFMGSKRGKFDRPPMPMVFSGSFCGVSEIKARVREFTRSLPKKMEMKDTFIYDEGVSVLFVCKN